MPAGRRCGVPPRLGGDRRRTSGVRSPRHVARDGVHLLAERPAPRGHARRPPSPRCGSPTNPCRTAAPRCRRRVTVTPRRSTPSTVAATWASVVSWRLPLRLRADGHGHAARRAAPTRSPSPTSRSGPRRRTASARCPARAPRAPMPDVAALGARLVLPGAPLVVAELLEQRVEVRRRAARRRCGRRRAVMRAGARRAAGCGAARSTGSRPRSPARSRSITRSTVRCACGWPKPRYAPTGQVVVATHRRRPPVLGIVVARRTARRRSPTTGPMPEK